RLRAAGAGGPPQAARVPGVGPGAPRRPRGAGVPHHRPPARGVPELLRRPGLRLLVPAPRRPDRFLPAPGSRRPGAGRQPELHQRRLTRSPRPPGREDCDMDVIDRTSGEFKDALELYTRT